MTLKPVTEDHNRTTALKRLVINYFGLKHVCSALQMSEAIVDTFVATDTVVKDTMRKVWDDNNYLVCPHTAIAVAYHYSRIRSL